MPLNSMTLSARKPTSTSMDEAAAPVAAENNEGRKKRPWWESLPYNKNQKNKNILEQYDKLKSSVPEWPWMSTLKEANATIDVPLTRKKVKDTVRVVMSTTGSTEKPIMRLKTTSEATLMPSTTTTTSEGKQLSKVSFLVRAQ